MFRDRREAGLRLAGALAPFKQENPLVLAIPRGGVEVGCHVAAGLDATLAILVVRKLPLPTNPEAGFGAIAEDGSTVMVDLVANAMTPETVQEILRQQRREITRRVEVLRQGRPLPEIEGRTAILVDDGIAMGSTIRAAVAMCRNRKAGRIIVASPVAGPTTARDLRQIADEVVILETPASFRAVAQVYENWYDVSDDEVLAIMRRYERRRCRPDE